MPQYLRRIIILSIITLALFLTGCLGTTTPLTTPTLLNPIQVNPAYTPTAIPLTPTDSPVIPHTPVVITPLINPPPMPPAIQTVTVIALDGSSLSASMYTCPRAQASNQVPVSPFRVVNTFPHDTHAYTEGLIYRDGFLYEGTGLNGASWLRKVILETGQVVQQHDLDPAYFGEGITELDGKIYQLTWKEHTGFIYQRDTFDLLGTFNYPTQGWGLTHDGKQLIMSDGTEYLYFLDPDTLAVERSLPVFDERGPVVQLNELEYVNGEIWANVYLTSCIARIDPDTGQVVGWIDLSDLLEPADLPGAQVPNGIAFDPGSGRLFVTGKYWTKLFEIELTGE